MIKCWNRAANCNAPATLTKGLMRLNAWLAVGGWGGHVSLVINWMWSCSLLKGRRTLRRDSERENTRERDDCDEDGWDARSKWERLRVSGGCEMSSFLRSAVVWSRGYVAEGENAEVPIHIKDATDAFLSPFQLDAQKRLKNYMYFFSLGSAYEGYR